MKTSQIASLALIFLLCLLTPGAASAELKLKHYGITSGRIVFTYTHGEQKDLYVIDFKELTIEPLVDTPALDEFPRWSPDGTKVAFYSDVSGNREIYSINSDGTDLQQLTRHKAVDEDPDWSPDGNKIVFHSSRLGKGSNLFIMNADGSSPKALTKGKNKNTVPKWSPRATEIIYSTNGHWPGWDIMLYDMTTKKSKLLTNGFRSFCRASWNPDGGSFAFSYGNNKDIDIWVQSKGGKPSQLTNLPGRDYDAVWSDNGQQVFFVSELSQGAGNYQLFMIDLESKEVSQITEGDGAIRHPDWTPFNALPRVGEKPEPGEIEENTLIETGVRGSGLQ